MINMTSFVVMKGKLAKKDLAEAIEWASAPANRRRLWSEWRRLNERD
jgi:hypothetical protein